MTKGETQPLDHTPDPKHNREAGYFSVESQGHFSAKINIRTANCCLPASEIPPAETLKYLLGAEPFRLKITLIYLASV